MNHPTSRFSFPCFIAFRLLWGFFCLIFILDDSAGSASYSGCISIPGSCSIEWHIFTCRYLLMDFFPLTMTARLHLQVCEVWISWSRSSERHELVGCTSHGPSSAPPEQKYFTCWHQSQWHLFSCWLSWMQRHTHSSRQVTQGTHHWTEVVLFSSFFFWSSPERIQVESLFVLVLKIIERLFFLLDAMTVFRWWVMMSSNAE